MELSVLKTDGKSAGHKVKLPKEVFGIEPNEHAVYLAVKVQNKNARQGTVSTKTRSEVRGGGKKPWRQKGRGVARAGTIRSPLWVGGGRTFGPRPRDLGMKIPKKVKALARASVLSSKAKDESIKVIEDFKLDNPKTKEMFAVLRSLGVENRKTLLLTTEFDQMILRAGRNIPNLRIRTASAASTYDLLACDCLLIQESALKQLSGALKR